MQPLLSPGMLTASHRDRHPTEIAKLRGARLVTAPEMEKGAELAINKLKLVTGGDRLTARKMHQDFVEFEPTFKLVLVGNALPKLADVDEAIRRRLRIIPFSVTIPPTKRDPGWWRRCWQRLTVSLPGRWRVAWHGSKAASGPPPSWIILLHPISKQLIRSPASFRNAASLGAVTPAAVVNCTQPGKRGLPAETRNRLPRTPSAVTSSLAAFRRAAEPPAVNSTACGSRPYWVMPDEPALPQPHEYIGAHRCHLPDPGGRPHPHAGGKVHSFIR